MADKILEIAFQESHEDTGKVIQAITTVDAPYMVEETSSNWCFGKLDFHPMSSIKGDETWHDIVDHLVYDLVVEDVVLFQTRLFKESSSESTQMNVIIEPFYPTNRHAYARATKLIWRFNETKEEKPIGHYEVLCRACPDPPLARQRRTSVVDVAHHQQRRGVHPEHHVGPLNSHTVRTRRASVVSDTAGAGTSHASLRPSSAERGRNVASLTLDTPVRSVQNAEAAANYLSMRTTHDFGRSEHSTGMPQSGSVARGPGSNAANRRGSVAMAAPTSVVVAVRRKSLAYSDHDDMFQSMYPQAAATHSSGMTGSSGPRRVHVSKAETGDHHSMRARMLLPVQGDFGSAAAEPFSSHEVHSHGLDDALVAVQALHARAVMDVTKGNDTTKLAPGLELNKQSQLDVQDEGKQAYVHGASDEQLKHEIQKSVLEDVTRHEAGSHVMHTSQQLTTAPGNHDIRDGGKEKELDVVDKEVELCMRRNGVDEQDGIVQVENESSNHSSKISNQSSELSNKTSELSSERSEESEEESGSEGCNTSEAQEDEQEVVEDDEMMEQQQHMVDHDAHDAREDEQGVEDDEMMEQQQHMVDHDAHDAREDEQGVEDDEMMQVEHDASDAQEHDHAVQHILNATKLAHDETAHSHSDGTDLQFVRSEDEIVDQSARQAHTTNRLILSSSMSEDEIVDQSARQAHGKCPSEDADIHECIQERVEERVRHQEDASVRQQDLSGSDRQQDLIHDENMKGEPCAKRDGDAIGDIPHMMRGRMSAEGEATDDVDSTSNIQAVECSDEIDDGHEGHTKAMVGGEQSSNDLVSQQILDEAMSGQDEGQKACEGHGVESENDDVCLHSAADTPITNMINNYVVSNHGEAIVYGTGTQAIADSAANNAINYDISTQDIPPRARPILSDATPHVRTGRSDQHKVRTATMHDTSPSAAAAMHHAIPSSQSMAYPHPSTAHPSTAHPSHSARGHQSPYAEPLMYNSNQTGLMRICFRPSTGKQRSADVRPYSSVRLVARPRSVGMPLIRPASGSSLMYLHPSKDALLTHYSPADYVRLRPHSGSSNPLKRVYTHATAPQRPFSGNAITRSTRGNASSGAYHRTSSAHRQEKGSLERQMLHNSVVRDYMDAAADIESDAEEQSPPRMRAEPPRPKLSPSPSSQQSPRTARLIAATRVSAVNHVTAMLRPRASNQETDSSVVRCTQEDDNMTVPQHMIYRRKAASLFAAGRLKSAKEMYFKALHKASWPSADRVSIILSVAQIDEMLGAPQAAIRWYQRLCDTKDVEIDHYCTACARMGLVMLTALNDVRGAEAYFKQSLQRDPSHIETMDFYCYLLQRDRKNEAHEMHKRICKLDPSHLLVNCLYVQNLFGCLPHAPPSEGALYDVRNRETKWPREGATYDENQAETFANGDLDRGAKTEAIQQGFNIAERRRALVGGAGGSDRGSKNYFKFSTLSAEDLKYSTSSKQLDHAYSSKMLMSHSDSGTNIRVEDSTVYQNLASAMCDATRTDQDDEEIADEPQLTKAEESWRALTLVLIKRGKNVAFVEKVLIMSGMTHSGLQATLHKVAVDSVNAQTPTDKPLTSSIKSPLSSRDTSSWLPSDSRALSSTPIVSLSRAESDVRSFGRLYSSTGSPHVSAYYHHSITRSISSSATPPSSGIHRGGSLANLSPSSQPHILRPKT